MRTLLEKVQYIFNTVIYYFLTCYYSMFEYCMCCKTSRWHFVEMKSDRVRTYVSSGHSTFSSDALAAGHKLRALLLAEIDVVEDLLELVLVDLRRVHRLLVERVACLSPALLRQLGAARHELVVDVRVHEGPRGSAAHLHTWKVPL